MKQTDLPAPPSIGKLYIIMREDLPDLTPGKLGAQAAHASSMFSVYAERSGANGTPISGYDEWERQGGHFGTTIVLRGTRDQVHRIVEIADRYDHIPSDQVNDTSYPFRTYEGKIFTMPVTTCAYVFIAADQQPCRTTEMLAEMELF